jgi:hypothetical protein
MKLSYRTKSFLFLGLFGAYLLLLSFKDTHLSKRTLVYPRTIIAISFILLALKLIAMFVPKLKFLLGGAADDIYRVWDTDEERPSKVSLSPARSQKHIVAKFMAWMISFVVGIYYLGFIPSMPAWLFIFCFFLSKLGFKKSAIITVSMFIGVYVTFVMILRMHFPGGILF